MFHYTVAAAGGHDSDDSDALNTTLLISSCCRYQDLCSRFYSYYWCHMIEFTCRIVAKHFLVHQLPLYSDIGNYETTPTAMT